MSDKKVALIVNLSSLENKDHEEEYWPSGELENGLKIEMLSTENNGQIQKR